MDYIFGSGSSSSQTISFCNHELIKFLKLIFLGFFLLDQSSSLTSDENPTKLKEAEKMEKYPRRRSPTLCLIWRASVPFHHQRLWLPGCAQRTHIHPFTASQFSQFSLGRESLRLPDVTRSQKGVKNNSRHSETSTQTKDHKTHTNQDAWELRKPSLPFESP